jgi:hypothetical protein
MIAESPEASSSARCSVTGRPLIGSLWAATCSCEPSIQATASATVLKVSRTDCIHTATLSAGRLSSRSP